MVSMRNIASHHRQWISWIRQRYAPAARMEKRFHFTWQGFNAQYSRVNFFNNYLTVVGFLLFFANENILQPFPAICDPLAFEFDSNEYFDGVYEITNMIGFGAFGVVMQCIHKETGRVYAVKMIHDVDDVTFEDSALLCVRENGGHPHILEYCKSYRHNGFHYLVTEFIDGDSLISYLSAHGPLSEEDAIQLADQLVCALNYLHSNHIIHRDVKPENIMVQKPIQEERNETPCLKLIDFGSAVVSSSDQWSSAKRVLTSGTRTYWSPEALRDGDVSPAMDIWSLGCTLYILICGRHPFDLHGCLKEEEIVERIVSEDPVEFPDQFWQHVSGDVKELVSGLLEKDPRKRWNLEQVRASTVFSK